MTKADTMKNPVTEDIKMDESPITTEAEVPVVEVFNTLTASERKRFENEPILQKSSNVNGMVELFAPNAPASEWATLPWLLKCQRGSVGAPYQDHESTSMKVELLAAHAHEAYVRPYFAEDRNDWHYLTVPVEAEPELVEAAPAEGKVSRLRRSKAD
jgi:hypothetical protein